MSITKMQYKQAQKVIRQALDVVPRNKTWEYFCFEWGIGEVVGKHVQLNSNDRAKLRDLLINSTCGDPVIDDVKGDRIEVAKTFIDEKWSSTQVFENIIYVSSAKPIKTTEGEAINSPNSFLAVDSRKLVTDSVIIIVENGQVIRRWHDYAQLLPDELNSCMAIYRGHDSSSRYVKNYLNSLTNTHKIGFFDYDIAGLNIANTLDVDDILVPDKPEDLLCFSHFNRFEIQKKAYPNIQDSLPEKWFFHFDWMREHKASISQEAMLAGTAPLIL